MASFSSFNSISKMSNALIDTFASKPHELNEGKVTVNQLLSKVASYYEKLRTAMDYGNEETILRRAIERILKRMLLLEANPKMLSESLIRELVWAGYFPDATVPQSAVEKTANSIELYLKLKDEVIQRKLLPNDDVYDFILQLLTCEIDVILLPNKEKEAMANFMFHILRNSVTIVDDSKQTKDVQVFIAIRKNFARDDIAFLNYNLFRQIFGPLSHSNLETTLSNFKEGYTEIKSQLSYPKKERIFNHIKKYTPPFLILYDILMDEKRNMKNLVKDEQQFRTRVYAACDRRYKRIKNKVRTAIIRSFIFILFTKAFVALAIEGTFERFIYGNVAWLSIFLNITVPPVLMAIVGLGIRTPEQDNSELIYRYIERILTEDEPKIAPLLSIRLKSNRPGMKDTIFSILWFMATLLSFGLISYLLTKLHFNPLSQAIFLFFIAIISFLTYRIYQTANIYTVLYKQNIFTPLVDFFFVPIVRVGRRLTEGISQINFLLIVIDFIIEAPFKALVGFFEQWFSFVANKREELE